MTEPEPRLPRARVRDLFRPARLYEGIEARPTFLWATLLLVLSATLYTEVAADVVLPSLVSALLDRSLVTESALRRTLHLGLLVASVVAPMLWIPLGAGGSALVLRVGRARIPYWQLLSLIAYSALWLAFGFVVKAGIVWTTGNPTPATNLGALLEPEGFALRAAVALTNPFLIAAVVWTARGLRRWGVHAFAAWSAGATPWVVTAVVFATAFAGDVSGGISAPVPIDDWPTVTSGSITLRVAPELADTAEGVATDLDRFAASLTDRFGLEPRPVRVYLYPDHGTLERAVGVRLHVLTTGSIRGSDLVYLEMPGRSAAVPADRGRRDALRLIAIVQLAPVTSRAPRWFVEGFVHATVEPSTPELDREFRTLLRRSGVPSLDTLAGGAVFGTPGGPLLARSLIDHIAALHGPATVVEILRDVVDGTDFRDALFSHTRLTASELEARWQDNLRGILTADPDDAEGAP